MSHSDLLNPIFNQYCDKINETIEQHICDVPFDSIETNELKFQRILLCYRIIVMEIIAYYKFAKDNDGHDQCSELLYSTMILKMKEGLHWNYNIGIQALLKLAEVKNIRDEAQGKIKEIGKSVNAIQGKYTSIRDTFSGHYDKDMIITVKTLVEMDKGDLRNDLSILIDYFNRLAVVIKYIGHSKVNILKYRPTR
jgi:hypothetical protein